MILLAKVVSFDRDMRLGFFSSCSEPKCWTDQVLLNILQSKTPKSCLIIWWADIADNAQMVLEDNRWANLHKNTWRVLFWINATAQYKLSQNRQATI